MHDEDRDEPEQKPAATPASLAGASVLVVEDDPDLCRQLVLWLSQAGAIAEGCPAVTIAWHRLCHERWSAMLVDWRLPDGDGAVHLALPERPGGMSADAARRLGRVLLTGFALGSDRELELQARGVVVLHKPVTAETIVRAVQLATGRGLLQLGTRTELVVEIDPVRVDLVAREVTVFGHPKRMQPLTLAVLTYLMQHAGRFVGPEELLERVWRSHHQQTRVVRNQVALARAALGLGDTFIQTSEEGTGWGIRL